MSDKLVQNAENHCCVASSSSAGAASLDDESDSELELSFAIEDSVTEDDAADVVVGAADDVAELAVPPVLQLASSKLPPANRPMQERLNFMSNPLVTLPGKASALMSTCAIPADLPRWICRAMGGCLESIRPHLQFAQRNEWRRENYSAGRTLKDVGSEISYQKSVNRA